MATLQDLEAENPNITQQYQEWTALRSERGEDPTDYEAFRQHIIGIGGPDPGPDEIDNFVTSDFRTAHPERYDLGDASGVSDSGDATVLSDVGDVGDTAGSANA